MPFSVLRPKRLCCIFLAALSMTILGCSANVPSTSTSAGGQLRGTIHGGQQPVSGASVQLYAAATTDYGDAATPLLPSPVISDANGGFSITSDYTCPSSTSQLYIVVTGGNPGLAPGTNNAALGLMTALGSCSLHGGQYTLDPNSFISINEVTTVASVYALAGFMGADATHLGTSSANAVGLANAFQTVNNLVNTTTGAALSVTPAGNGTVPQAEINTLANVVASCVNSDGTGSACSGFAVAATPPGGTQPTDTIQGLIDVARNPANNVSTIYGLASATPPFQPTLPTTPNDWTLGLNFTGGGLSLPQGMAVDAAGNVWIANNGTATNSASSVTELSSNGAFLSGATGYTGGGMTRVLGIAIDPAGNVWVSGSGQVVKLSSTGAILSGTNGFTGGGLNSPRGIAIDGNGNAWVADFDAQSVIELSNSGAILSGPAGFTAGGSTQPGSIAIDSAGNAWVGNQGDNTVTELSNSGAVLSGATGYNFGGQVHPAAVAIDASGKVWFMNGSGGAAFELDSSGSLLSPAAGYPTCVSPPVPVLPGRLCNYGFAFPQLAIDGSSNIWGGTVNDFSDVNGNSTGRTFGLAELNTSGSIISGPSGYVPTGSTTVVIDGSGNVWTDNAFGNNVTELIGVATPVVAPFSVGVKNGTLGRRP